MQEHGTTKKKPFELFAEQEKPYLIALPDERFDIPLWKEAKVHPDHHIVFDKSYYSLPTRYIGKKVWVRGGMEAVRIFYDGELIKTHQRAYRAGTWRTEEKDYPPQKSKYIMKGVSYYQTEAMRYGHHVTMLITKIMAEHAYRNIRKVQTIFRLADKYGHTAMDMTSKRCLYYEDTTMSTIKGVLQKGLYNLPFEQEIINTSRTDSAFIRSPEYFAHTIKEAE
ncbi:MAG: hypothetical protein DDT31_01888 [Syntrophomonadaceae bacterium]|nr:hypothetical protein [Bacillota bacterium]